MLFLKRASDLFDQRREALLQELTDQGMSAGAIETLLNDPDQYSGKYFYVSENAHWPKVKHLKENVGTGLNMALEAIEDNNIDALQDVLKGINLNRKIGQRTLDDDTLPGFIQNFEKVPLRDEDFEFPDLMGAAYEWLIKFFAGSAGKKAGEFTPRSVVALMVRILAPKAGETIYDPAGGMLLEALHHVKEHGGDENLMLGKLCSLEKNLTTSSIARMNLFLHGAEDFHIEHGDTLSLPAFYSGDSLATFDCITANPSFSLEKWCDDVWINDPYGRNFAGLPPTKSGDFAWVHRPDPPLHIGLAMTSCDIAMTKAATSWELT